MHFSISVWKLLAVLRNIDEVMEVYCKRRWGSGELVLSGTLAFSGFQIGVLSQVQIPTMPPPSKSRSPRGLNWLCALGGRVLLSLTCQSQQDWLIVGVHELPEESFSSLLLPSYSNHFHRNDNKHLYLIVPCIIQWQILNTTTSSPAVWHPSKVEECTLEVQRSKFPSHTSDFSGVFLDERCLADLTV